MKKLILFLLITCLLHQILPAQQDITAVAYSINGKVKYAAGPDAKLKKLQSGMELAPEGIVKIYPGASLGISYDEEYGVVNTAGQQSVAAITENVSLFQETDLSELFGAAIDKAFNPYFQVRSGFAVAGDPPPPPPNKTGKDGAGNKDYKIIRRQPTGGKVSGEKVHFSWTLDNPSLKVKKFKFTLRSADNKILLEKTVKGNDFELDASDYPMHSGTTYKWQVMAEDNPEISSPNITFDYLDSAVIAKISNDLAAAGMYKTASRVAKLMLEASVLEQADFLAAAHDRYQLIAKKNKKNQLAQLLLQAFEFRYDMIE